MVGAHRYIGKQCLLYAVGIACLAPASSVAQEIEEIIVTAQKREEALTDIGMSITAISGEQFDSLGMTHAVDLAAHTPGLTSQNAIVSGTPIFAIRGMGLDDFHVNNNSGVGVYLDGVAANSPVFLHGQLMDTDRVEILKGPQGTLYGKNATGGVINYISRRPTDEPEGYLTASYGRWSTADVTGAISGPLGETTKGRLAVNYHSGDDWQRDLDTGAGFGETDQLALRGMLTFEPTDALSAMLSVHYSNEDTTPASSQVQNTEANADAFYGLLPDVLDLIGMPIEGLLDTGSTDPRDVRVGALPVEKDDEGFGLGLQWTWEGEHFGVHSITAWDTHEHFLIENTDGNPGPNFEVTHQDVEADQFYQELRAYSQTGRMIDWIVGVTYSTDEIDTAIGQDFSLVSLIQTTPFDTGLFVADSVYSQESESFGIYANTETHFTDQLDLTVGVRYSSDERQFVGVGTNTFGGFNFTTDSEDTTEEESDFSYRVALEYHVNDDWLVYGSVATAYKNGVFFSGPPLSDASWSYVEPEEVFGYELGVNGNLLEQRLLVHAAFFNYKLDDRQAFAIFWIPGDLLEVGLTNIPESEIQGGELEVSFSPATGLNIQFGIAYLDTEVTETIDDVRGFPLLTPLPVGASLSLSPEWSYNAIARYGVPLANGYALEGQVDYSYRDSIAGILSDANAIVGTRENLGARLTLSSGDRWSLSAWGRNLTDENSEVRAFSDFFGARALIRQLPRTYGVEATYHLF